MPRSNLHPCNLPTVGVNYKILVFSPVFSGFLNFTRRWYANGESHHFCPCDPADVPRDGARLRRALSRAGPPEEILNINRIAFRIFLPCLLFYNVYCSDLSGSFDPLLIAYAVGGVLLSFALALGYTLLTGKAAGAPRVMSRACSAALRHHGPSPWRRHCSARISSARSRS